MGLAEETRVSVVVADYAAADPIGKINIIGGYFQLIAAPDGVVRGTQSVMAILDIPRKYAGDEAAVSIELRDETSGQPVTIPLPNGRNEPLRVSQNVAITAPMVPGVSLPREVPCRVQIAMALPPGLSLISGHEYAWKVSLDGTHRKGWEARFWVVGGQSPPVFGGPAGPADIPNVSF